MTMVSTLRMDAGAMLVAAGSGGLEWYPAFLYIAGSMTLIVAALLAAHMVPIAAIWA